MVTPEKKKITVKRIHKGGRSNKGDGHNILVFFFSLKKKYKTTKFL